MPPETGILGQGLELGVDELQTELSSASSWDVAIRYHELRSKLPSREQVRRLRRVSAEAVLERARAVLGSVVHPMEIKVDPWSQLPPEAIQPEVDLEETIEAAPLGVSGALALAPQDIWMAYQARRRQSLVLAVDTSLSMTGEKLALTAVAVAVVLLQFPEDPIGIVAFENEAKVLKRPEERISVKDLVERFLDVPAQGYTHLEDGLRTALRIVEGNLIRKGSGRPSVVLLTDGKYTAGRDPAYLAPRFPHLVVLKMGRERASLDLCRELALGGHGSLHEVAELESLPAQMYDVVKTLLRGRARS